MNVTTRQKRTGMHQPGGPQLLGLRPVPLLLAAGIATVSMWVIVNPGSPDQSTGNRGPAPVAEPASVPGDPRGAAGIPSAGSPSGGASGTLPERVATAPVTRGGSSETSSAAEPSAPVARPSAAAAGSSGGTGGQGRAEALPAGVDRSGGESMYLTIVGDQTYLEWAPAGRRTARLDDLASAARRRSATAPAAEAIAEDALDGSGYAGAETASLPPENDLGPEPQQCPRTLPPGSTQGDADQLRAQFGCRYLASCRVWDGGQCSFHYQGRG